LLIERERAPNRDPLDGLLRCHQYPDQYAIAYPDQYTHKNPDFYRYLNA
jgi:hypothetical protein